ncbi:MAG TPA: UDP-N-acetylmuramoyl-tripeptide--D-alanyl-D-alanine ligase [Candidatus Xenobia bacterium]|jgi:UDP-N-acetylmuramoyl-tripeptide--D-alanyl-D-alanine ligase
MLTLQDVIFATGGVPEARLPALSTGVRGVTTDSRRVRAGELFVPLRGERFDGHRFLAQALGDGAVACLSEEAFEGPVVRVGNTLAAYQALARWHREQFPQCAVVAVTGSNGKTLTKDLLAHLLSQSRPVIKTPANLNNEIGLPQTLFLIGEGTEAAVVEMGMRGRGQIAELAAIARPQVGVITTIGEAHLELLGSREAIADAKAELVEGLAPGGTSVLPRDNPYYERLRAKASGPVLTFGSHAEADVRVVAFEPLGWHGSRVRVSVTGQELTVDFPLLGRHLVDNLLAALAACRALGAPLKLDLSKFEASGQRLEPVRTGRGMAVINDAYNASPTSVRGALELLPHLPCQGRRIAVLGDMLELGPVEVSAHEDVGRMAARVGVDVLVAVGERSRRMAEVFGESGRPVVRAAHAAQAVDEVLKLVRPEDLVLVKASHSIGLEAVVEALQARA